MRARELPIVLAIVAVALSAAACSSATTTSSPASSPIRLAAEGDDSLSAERRLCIANPTGMPMTVDWSPATDHQEITPSLPGCSVGVNVVGTVKSDMVAPFTASLINKENNLIEIHLATLDGQASQAWTYVPHDSHTTIFNGLEVMANGLTSSSNKTQIRLSLKLAAR